MGHFFENFKFDRLDRLAKRMKRGDERAAEALYRELTGKVFGFCMNRVQNRAVAEDITQEIFLKLVRNIKLYDERRGRFGVWFWKLARNAVIDYYRREHKEGTTLEAIGDIHNEMQGPYDPAGTVDAKMTNEQVGAFVSRLGGDDQELFRLRYVAELSYQEIADVLGKSEGALRVAAMRLKKKLRNSLET